MHCLSIGIAVYSLWPVSVVISSIGLGGGVVAMVQPIHAPINRIPMNPTKTGIAMTQNCTAAELLMPITPNQDG